VAIVHAELDLERVASIRRQIPVLANRRPDAVARVDDR
jgi:predicted amidohydrolase